MQLLLIHSRTKTMTSKALEREGKKNIYRMTGGSPL